MQPSQLASGVWELHPASPLVSAYHSFTRSPTQNAPLVYYLLAVESDSYSGSKDAKKALGCSEGGRVKKLVTFQGCVTLQLSPTQSVPASLRSVLGTSSV